MAFNNDEWHSMPELPSAEEILTCNTPMPPTPAEFGSWTSKEEYLQAQYLMARYDSTESLKRIVSAVHDNPGSMDNELGHVYDKVFATGYVLSSFGPACRVQFSHRAPGRIKWSHTKRFTPGSLVALSPTRDSFNSVCIIAAVASRDLELLDKFPPKVDLLFARPELDAILDPSEPFMMVAARSGYYEAKRHLMMGLQSHRSMNSSFDKYLINGSSDDLPAPFVEENPWYNLSCINNKKDDDDDDAGKRTDNGGNNNNDNKNGKVGRSTDRNEDGPGPVIDQVNLLDGIPEGTRTTMDSSQLLALNRILTKEVAIIQGPPGTGKTYTSVSALEVMIKNRQRGDPPIIVSSHTNHALDQILELCMGFARVARMGGRSESQEVSSRTMYYLRQEYTMPRHGKGKGAEGKYRRAQANLKAAGEGIHRFLKLAFPEDGLSIEQLVKLGIISEKMGKDLLEDEFADENNVLESWIYPAKLCPVQPRESRIDVMMESDMLADEYQEFEELGLDDEDVVDDDADLEGQNDSQQLHGEFVPLDRGLVAQSEVDVATAEATLAGLGKNKSITTIRKGYRGAIYNLWLSKVRQYYLSGLRARLVEYDRSCKMARLARFGRNAPMIENLEIEIVGCTTTGLTKYREFMEMLRPRILLVEEAAETTEGNVASALFPTLQQLVLVGDHKQLKPITDRFEMGEAPYTLNMSMFERLVEVLDTPYVMLNKQRRMVPEIRQVLKPFYHDLEDHPLVRNRKTRRPHVKGMGGRDLWFFNHTWSESTDSNKSKYNAEEGQMVVQFANYLSLNGAPPASITILTFYNGQRKYISGLLRTKKWSFKVSTVDSYQGEENDIVLLSLVRSNKGGSRTLTSNIGFLKEQNRAVVACSRARRGFYVFGNTECILTCQSDEARALWFSIVQGFIPQSAIRDTPELPLVCEKHGNPTTVTRPDDLVTCHGGCHLPCEEVLPCGHQCALNCHYLPHERFKCMAPCDRTLSCGHRCSEECGSGCECVKKCPLSLRTMKALEAASVFSPPEGPVPHRSQVAAMYAKAEVGGSQLAPPLTERPSPPGDWENHREKISNNDRAYMSTIEQHASQQRQDCRMNDIFKETPIIDGRRAAALTGKTLKENKAKPLGDTRGTLGSNQPLVGVGPSSSMAPASLDMLDSGTKNRIPRASSARLPSTAMPSDKNDTGSRKVKGRGGKASKANKGGKGSKGGHGRGRNVDTNEPPSPTDTAIPTPTPTHRGMPLYDPHRRWEDDASETDDNRTVSRLSSSGEDTPTPSMVTYLTDAAEDAQDDLPSSGDDLITFD